MTLKIKHQKYLTMGNSWSDIFDGDDSLAKNVVPIATSPRSGSHFLCSLLYLSGLGVPFEYFIKGTIDQYHERFKIEGRVSKGDYLNALLQHRTRNRVLSFKLNPSHIKRIEWKKIIHLPMWFIWLRRRDISEQAISMAAASMTGKWGIGEETSPLIHPKAQSINDRYLQCKQFLKECDQAWLTFFDKQNVKPYTLWYEDITSADRAAETLAALPFNIDIQKISPLISSPKPYDTNFEIKEKIRNEIEKFS